jgi:flagellar motor switch protein FliN/FliY
MSDEPTPRAEVGPAPRPALDTMLGDVPLELTVELGRVTMNLRDLASRLGPGSVIPLSKLAGERLDVRVNDRLVARAEAVAVGERYGIRIVEITRGEGSKAP